MIRLRPVIQLVIMGSRIAVLVPRKQVLFAVEPKNRPDWIEDKRFGHGRAEAAIILGIVDKERGPGRSQSSQMGEVVAIEHIRSGLFEVSKIAILFGFHTARDGGEACYRNRNLYPLVERAQGDGLPPAAGKSRYAQPVGIDIRV